MKRFVFIIIVGLGFFKSVSAQFGNIDTSATVVDTIAADTIVVNTLVADTAVAVDTTTAQWIRHKAVQDSIANEKIYEGAQHSAEFPGGGPAFRYFIEKNMIYPPLAKANNIQGNVFVTFVVDKKGVVKHVTLKKGIGYGCDEEAVRLARKMPKWKPGIWYDDNPIHTRVTMSIPFVLPK
jgi:TonB family protein